MMKRVGLTGGIGAGKSLIAQIFEVLGIPLFYSDAEAKKLMNHDPALRTEIIDHFGDQAYRDQQLNRPYLASIVFRDEKKLSLLNSLVHPAVRSAFARWAEQQSAPYVINEAALHYESGGFRQMDFMISVSAPLELRLERVTQRDDISIAQVKDRMKNQWPQEKKDALADYVIYNDGSRSLISQVLKCHRYLIQSS